MVWLFLGTINLPDSRVGETLIPLALCAYAFSVGKTLVNRTTGLKNANDALKGRIFEVSLADLQKDEDHAFRKIKLRVDEVQGKNCLTNFHGLDFTSDKLRSLVRKWQTLIEANVIVKTTDDYLIRLFAIAFTKRRPNQVKKTTYAASSQIRAIRKKMVEIIQREASSCTLPQLTTKLIPEVIGREIEKATQGIYPLQNVSIVSLPFPSLYPVFCSWCWCAAGSHTQSQASQGAQIWSWSPPQLTWRVHNRWTRAESGEGIQGAGAWYCVEAPPEGRIRAPKLRASCLLESLRRVALDITIVLLADQGLTGGAIIPCFNAAKYQHYYARS